MISKDARKVLNLLEFCLEISPDTHRRGTDSVYDVLLAADTSECEDPSWNTDEDWAQMLQAYANKLLKETKDV